MLKLCYPRRFDRVSVGIYLAMGWSGVMLYDAVVRAVPALVLGFILAGGLLYSFGVIFHAWRRLRFQNAIWHGFVLAGAACHYTAKQDHKKNRANTAKRNKPKRYKTRGDVACR